MNNERLEHAKERLAHARELHRMVEVSRMTLDALVEQRDDAVMDALKVCRESEVVRRLGVSRSLVQRIRQRRS